MVTARQRRLISWEDIKDEQRTLSDTDYGYDSPEQYIEISLRNGYCREIWTGCSKIVVLWVEKRALQSIVERVAGEWRLPSCSGGGFDSWTMIHTAAKAFRNFEEVVILFAGDFDPQGVEIGASLEKRLNEIRDYVDFRVPEVRMRRVALTPEQRAAHNLPRNRLKGRSKLAEKHKKVYGAEALYSTELDALDPPLLASMFREAVLEELDLGHFNREVARETKEKARVQDVFDQIKRSLKRRKK